MLNAAAKLPAETMANFHSSITHEPMNAPASNCLTQYGLMAEKHWREFLPEDGSAARSGVDA